MGWLEPIQRAGIPLVFFSTRTRAELEAIHQELGLRHPFVAEDGGALYVPQRYFGERLARAADVAGYETVTFGRPHEQILTVLTTIARRLKVTITAMNDLSVRDVATACHLTLLQARLAKLRDHGELFKVEGGDTETLVQALRGAKLRCRPAGPFMHVSAEVDVGGVVDILRGWYRRSFNRHIFVGIGDPHADLTMLRKVQVPLVWNARVGGDSHPERVRRDADAIGAHAGAAVELIQQLTTTLELSRLSLHERSR